MNDTFLEWVDREIKIKGLTHRKLAERAGVSNTFISSTISGRRSVTFGFCMAIAKGLNEPAWKILKMADLIDDIPEDVSENEEIKVLINKYLQLSDTEKYDLSNYLDWILLKKKK